MAEHWRIHPKHRKTMCLLFSPYSRPERSQKRQGHPTGRQVMTPEKASDEARGPSSYAYFVNDWPQVTWAWDLRERNLAFLNSIDPGYYEHIARTQAPLVEQGSADGQYAAASIRLAHAQAVETLFALLGSLAQAPQAAIGWMLAYQNRDLREVVQSLLGYEGLTETTPWVGGVTLSRLAEIVFSHTGWTDAKQTRTAEAFDRLWRHWSASLLDDGQVAEYNSFKHGSRAALGGHTISVGAETTPGVPAPADHMRSLGGSAFGSTFYVPTEVSGRLHRYPRRQSRNWSVPALVAGLDLVAMSIRNVVSILRMVGGDEPAKCEFQVPTDPAAFALPLIGTGGITSSSFDWNLRADQIEPWTKAEVLERLRMGTPSEG